jgi:glycosyltransferase involved in cell wall biosynthesis
MKEWKADSMEQSVIKLVQPSVDVIIPFHRVDEFLNQAIDSAQSSKGVRVQVIAINDSGQSVDKARLGLRETDTLIKSKSKGYLGALSTGFEACQSEYIAFLDSDDLQDSDRLFRQISSMEKENSDISSCSIQKFNGTSKSNFIKPMLGSLPTFTDERFKLSLGAYGADSTLVIRSTLVKENTKSHKDFPYQLADYGWMLLLLIQGAKYVHVDKVNYYYRLHKNQISRSAGLHAEWKIVYPVWLSFLERLELKTEGLTEELALLIAFPSSMSRIKKSEVHVLRILRNNLRPCMANEGLRNRFRLEAQFAAREFIGRRGLTWKSLWIGPYIFSNFLGNRSSIRLLRKNDT